MILVAYSEFFKNVFLARQRFEYNGIRFQINFIVSVSRMVSLLTDSRHILMNLLFDRQMFPYLKVPVVITRSIRARRRSVAENGAYNGTLIIYCQEGLIKTQKRKYTCAKRSGKRPYHINFCVFFQFVQNLSISYLYKVTSI